jgi:uncharacterized repeat protein (TIGR03803 family)
LGFGTVFKLDAEGNETVLHNFASGSDGATPHSGVIRDRNGNLYGTTYSGGTNDLGTVYKIAANSDETVLHSFDGNDGQYLEAGLVHDSHGNLYGTAVQGGPAGYMGGTIFEITRGGNLTVLFTFTGGIDGGGPAAGLSINARGDLFGTTAAGGASGHGTVFKLTPGSN